MRLWRWCIFFMLGVTVAFGARTSFEEHAAVQESLARVHPRARASWLRERGIDDPYYRAVRMPDSGQGLREVGRWSYGPSYDVDGRTTPSETLVALARGSGVSLLRFSRQDSLSIQLLSDINAEGLMCRVKVVDALLYVGSRKGLEVYNIADEQNPVRLSWIPIPLNDFVLQDSLVYTISGDDLFRIYNVLNPASPVFRGSCADSGDLVSVAGNAAFLGGRWGLYVVDVTNPASPHRIGSWGGAIEQVQARGHLCYVTTFNPSTPGEITFHILDVAVPSLPYQIGSLDSAGGNDVFLVDTLAYGAGENDFNKLTVISIADSTRPRLVGSAATRGWSYGIWASGLTQESFVGCHWEGLQIYDTRNTSSPVRDTFLLGCDQSVDIYIDDGRAYVANEMAGLKILDISDPTRPKTLGSYDTTWQRPFMSSVVARDSFAFVDWYAVPVFRVMDVSIPSQPVMLDGVDVFNPPEDMVLRDSFVYCAEMNRFQIVNVARPREPALVGSCVLGGDVWDLDVEDSMAYVTSNVLTMVSIARPDSPRVVATWNTMVAVDVEDTIAYTIGSGAVWSVSVARPTQPYVLDTVGIPDWKSDVVVGESRLFAGGQTLYVIDKRDPRNLRLAGRWTPPEEFRRLLWSPPYIYAACYEAGVCIIETLPTGIAERRSTDLGPRGVFAHPSITRGILEVDVSRATGVVHVRDASGRRIAGPFGKGGDAHVRRLVIDLSGFPDGVYFIESATTSTALSAKVVKTGRR
jgi:hypothetical protein